MSEDSGAQCSPAGLHSPALRGTALTPMCRQERTVLGLAQRHPGRSRQARFEPLSLQREPCYPALFPSSFWVAIQNRTKYCYLATLWSPTLRLVADRKAFGRENVQPVHKLHNTLFSLSLCVSLCFCLHLSLSVVSWTSLSHHSFFCPPHPTLTPICISLSLSGQSQRHRKGETKSSLSQAPSTNACLISCHLGMWKVWTMSRSENEVLFRRGGERPQAQKQEHRTIC